MHSILQITRWPLRLVLTLGLVLAAPPASAASRPPWVHLRFEARKLLVKGWIELDVREGAGGASLRECPEAAGLTATSTYRIESEQKGGGRKRTVTWISAETGDVLQVLETQRDERWKLRRYGEAHAHVWRARPDRGEEDLPAESWTRRRDQHVGWDSALTRGLVATDGLGMVALASSPLLAGPGARLSAYTVSHDDVIRIDLVHAGEDDVEVDVLVTGAPALRGLVRARRIELRAEKLAGEEDDDEDAPAPFGLRGPVAVHVEERTGLPVLVSGRVPRLGEVRIRLTEAAVVHAPVGTRPAERDEPFPPALGVAPASR